MFRDMRPIALVMSIVVVVLLAACGGGEPGPASDAPEAEPTSAPASTVPTSVPIEPGTINAATGGEVTSEDGNLSLEIPAGALAEDMVIKVERLAESDWPDGLTADMVVGDVYELGPDGVTFAKPVVITRSFSADVLDTDLDQVMPLVLLFSRDRDGNWEVLDDVEISIVDGKLLVVAAISHFSLNVSSRQVFTEARFLEFGPEAYERIGSPFGIRARRLFSMDHVILDPRLELVTDKMLIDLAPPTLARDYRYLANCLREGEGTIDLSTRIEPSPSEMLPGSPLSSVFGRSAGTQTTFHIPVWCRPPEIEGIWRAWDGQTYRTEVHFDDVDGACGHPSFTEMYDVGFDAGQRQITLSNTEIVSYPFNPGSMSFNPGPGTDVWGPPNVQAWGPGVFLAGPYVRPCDNGEGQQTYQYSMPLLPGFFGGLPDATVSENMTCPDNPYQTLCFGRWHVNAWSHADGSRVPLMGDYYGSQSGYFTLPDESVIGVSIFNGCEVNEHHWVFTTNYSDAPDPYTLEVTDTTTGVPKTFFWPTNDPGQAWGDTNAFPMCP